jgi:hypothetical protein
VGGELSGVDRDRGLLLRFGSGLVLEGGELLPPRQDAGRSPGYFLPDVGIGGGVAFRFDEGPVVLTFEGPISLTYPIFLVQDLGGTSSPGRQLELRPLC